MELLQSSEPLNTTLEGLHVLLESRDNPNRGRPVEFWSDDNPTARYELSRIRELPTIRILAEQIGLCRPGEFSAATVEAIADRICHASGGRVDYWHVFRFDLPAVMQFLEDMVQRLGAAAEGKGRKARGRKPIDPERTRRIVAAWKTGYYKNYRDLARELGLSCSEVEKAIKRQDMQERRKR